MRPRLVSVAACAFLASFTVACRGDEDRALAAEPGGQETTGIAVSRIADGACARTERCGHLRGGGVADCRQDFLEGEGMVLMSACESRSVSPARLARCLSAIEAERCDDPGASARRIQVCRAMCLER